MGKPGNFRGKNQEIQENSGKNKLVKENFGESSEKAQILEKKN